MASDISKSNAVETVTVDTEQPVIQSSELHSMINTVNESLNKPGRSTINDELIQKIAESALTNSLNVNDIKDILTKFPPNGLQPNDYVDFVKSCNDKFVKQQNLNDRLEGTSDKAEIIKYFQAERLCQPTLETAINAMAKQRYDQQQTTNKPLQDVETAIANYNKQALDFGIQLAAQKIDGEKLNHDLITIGVNYFMNAQGDERHEDMTPASIAAGLKLIEELYTGDEAAQAKAQAKDDPAMVFTLIEGAKEIPERVTKAETAAKEEAVNSLRVSSESEQTSGSGLKS